MKPAGTVVDVGHEYNTRAWAPKYVETLAGHLQLGEAVRSRTGARLDVAWGPGPRQKLDYFPPGGTTRDLAVFIHGGYWQYRSSTKEYVSFLAPPFLERGIGFCALGYELCPEVDMDGMVAQLQEALSQVRRLLDPNRLVVLGHSAGAHLAAMLALTCPDVSGAAGISGLYDLKPLVPTYLNEALRMDEACAARNSPSRLAGTGACAMVLAVGGLESAEFKRQTREFGRVLGVSAHEVQGKDHYAATESLLSPGTLQESVMRLFR